MTELIAIPSSIREINDLPDTQKYGIYKTLLPEWIFTQYGIDKEKLDVESYDHPTVTFRCAPSSRSVEIIVRRRASDIDPLLYLNMADTFNQQLLVLLVVVNDLDSPRYNTDIDIHGNRTNFGTSTRNIPAEKEAMKAGLAPGQVRKGLRAFKETVPLFEEFVEKMGHDMFLIEPLAYHNAIVFEKYGFNYLRGLNEMKTIHQEFQPNGKLHQKLTPDSAFRHLDAWKTVRGRSWAIHDGILGHPFTGFQMYKIVGKNAGVNTFVDAKW